MAAECIEPLNQRLGEETEGGCSCLGCLPDMNEKGLLACSGSSVLLYPVLGRAMTKLSSQCLGFWAGLKEDVLDGML